MNKIIYKIGIYINKISEKYTIQKKFDFEIKIDFLSNIITEWKNNSNRFSKTSVLENPYDYQGRLILRDFRSIYIEVENKNPPYY